MILYVIDIAEGGEVAHSLDHLAPYSDKIIWILNKADLTLDADQVLPQIVEEAVRVSARDGDVEAAQHSLESNLSGEIAVFELKSALEHLGSITGKITNDVVLGAIFSKCCTGSSC